MINDIAGVACAIAGAVIIVVMAMRARGLTGEQRNTIATAVLGLFLCGRYISVVGGIGDWLFAISTAALMLMLAYKNLQPRREGRLDQ